MNRQSLERCPAPRASKCHHSIANGNHTGATRGCGTHAKANNRICLYLACCPSKGVVAVLFQYAQNSIRPRWLFIKDGDCLSAQVSPLILPCLKDSARWEQQQNERNGYRLHHLLTEPQPSIGRYPLPDSKGPTDSRGNLGPKGNRRLTQATILKLYHNAACPQHYLEAA
jgi:hypothetical protein